MDHNCITRFTDGKKASTKHYLVKQTKKYLNSCDWNLALVVTGACGYDLEAEHVIRLGQVNFNIDYYLAFGIQQQALDAPAMPELFDYKMFPLGR